MCLNHHAVKECGTNVPFFIEFCIRQNLVASYYKQMFLNVFPMEGPQNDFSYPNGNVHRTEKADRGCVTLQNKHIHCTTKSILKYKQTKTK